MRKCFNVKRSPILQLWSRHTLSTSPNGGIGDTSAELDTAPTPSCEVEEKLASLPSELLDEHVKQILKGGSEDLEELLPTQGLPLSPLMDPRLIAARNRHRAPKPRPSVPPSALRERLQKNPYAQALATPIRECSLTGARLPNAFLLDFGLAKNPKTNQLWHLPTVALDSSPSSAKAKESSSNPPSSEPTVETEPAIPSPQITPTTAPKTPIRTASHTHFLAHSPALHLISSLKRKNYIRFLPRRWKTDSAVSIESVIWREDMDAFVLEVLRNRIVKLLKYLGSRPAAYIAVCQGYEAVKESHQVAAMLYLGPLPPFPTTDLDVSSSNPNPAPPHPEPLPYATLPYKAHQIPIYNLPALLGQTHLQQLRESSKVFAEEMAVLKGKRGTVGVQSELWRLLGFVGLPSS